MKTGATAGAFDLFHREHKKFIDECRAGCDRLVVFLEDDELVRARRRPPTVLDFTTRERALLAYGVDDVRRLKSWAAPSEESLFEVFFVGDRQRERACWKAWMDELESSGRLKVMNSGPLTFAGLRYSLNIHPSDSYALERVASSLERSGVEHCAMFGTLLGMLRNGKKVPWDKDYDILVFGRDIEETRKILSAAGMQFRRMSGRLSWRRETSIDIFFLDGRGRVPHLPEYKIEREKMIPFERGTIDGVELPIPRNARELVDANYPGWECDFSVWRSYKPSKFDVNF